MMFDLRALALAALLAVPSSPVSSRDGQDPAALEFHGFRAGARLDELSAVVSGFAARLRCERARADRRVTECRARLDRPELGGATDLWLSAMDSVAGIITISGPVDAERLDRWRQTLVQRYGRVDTRVQGPQRTMQWVRRGRMLRLTWRVDGARTMASVSLVDGRVLDAWGQSERDGAGMR
jgi:hypothetical protein